MTVRKPSELRVIEGNRGKRPIPKSPQYAPLSSVPPRHLDRVGKGMWKRVATALETTRVLQQTDYYALVALCEQWSLYRRALADVEDRGHLVESTRDEGLVKNPSCLEASRALTAWTNLAARFGLTPSDRARLDVEHVEPETNPLEEIIAAANAERDARRARRAGS